ncbi:MAG: DNA repair protein RecN [Bacteroidota bacterium]|nr:DNA repair protein RecN [Bacteroidota bacterium]
MLTHLKVENFSLIRNLEIDFASGFTAITGETGAGKSIILGALALILGQRADTQTLMSKDAKCTVEGYFKIEGYDLKSFFEVNDLDYDVQTIIRREITPQGKSRAFINDTPVSLNVVKELGDRLINIHSQHETLTLGDAGFQLEIVDAVAENQNIVSQYRNLFDRHQGLKHRLAALLAEEKKSKSDQDYYQFQLNEFEQVNLKPGEKEELETELEIYNHAEQITNGLGRSSALLSENEFNIVDSLTEIQSIFNGLSSFKGEFEEIRQRVENNLIDLKDLSYQILRLNEQSASDPQHAEKVLHRLDMIYHLEQKHRVSGTEALLLLQRELSDKLSAITSLGDEILEITDGINKTNAMLKEAGKKLTESRKAVTAKITAEITATLKQLGIPDAVFRIQVEPLNEYTPSGADRIIFLFSANKGSQPGELSRIASGGELSRVMLAVKSLISQRKLLPTLIFDEIDTGVSGEVAGKVGNIMRLMSKGLQLIAITHLPQIAGMSDHHYMVYKEHHNGSTATAIRKLSKEERIMEIAKMLSNETVTEAAMETAKELLVNNRN